jgi:cephalosporin hydroxylase
MKVTIDRDAEQLIHEDNGSREVIPLFSAQAFEVLSREWLRVGWVQKYSYTFTWLGRPIIQLPEDMFRIQEVVYSVKPSLIIETGVAHGGSLIFYASLCKLIGKGRVIGIDIEIRPHNRQAIEDHPLNEFITLVEGSSIEATVVRKIFSMVSADDTVMVLLDSSHTKAHVLAELEAYSPLVTPGSYVVAMDGIMADVVGAPRSQPDWSWNNPQEAVKDFLAKHKNFVLSEPAFAFNEGMIEERLTYWPSAFLKRIA